MLRYKYIMLIKKIAPIQILNEYANVMHIELKYSIYKCDSEKYGLINFNSVTVQIEFYDENKKPIHNCELIIDELPVNNNINLINNLDFVTPDAKIMFDAQHQKILDEIKKTYGLTYYDETYETYKQIYGF